MASIIGVDITANKSSAKAANSSTVNGVPGRNMAMVR